MDSRYQLANYSLLIVFIGLLVFYPMEETFWGGFFFSFCCAAFIGGVADWFAVTALFQKPLNISSQSFGLSTDIIRTNIIIKNRERMFTMIRDMINKEILTKEQLHTRLHRINSSKVFLKIYSKEENQQYAEKIIREFIQYFLLFFNSERILHLLYQLYQQNDSVSLSKLLQNGLVFCQEEGYVTKGTTFSIKEMRKILKKDESLLLLERMIEQAKYQYVKENETRKSINTFIIEGLLQFSSMEMALTVQTFLVKKLEELENPTHLYRIRLEEKVTHFINRLETDSDLIEAIENWKKYTLKEYLHNETVENILLKGISTTFTSKQHEVITKTFIEILKSAIQAFSNDNTMQRVVNEKIEKVLTIFVDTQHKKLDSFLLEKLNALSDQELVDLIQKKAGNDLQMIRINGTVVGGIVGIVIYLLTYGWL